MAFDIWKDLNGYKKNSSLKINTTNKAVYFIAVFFTLLCFAVSGQETPSKVVPQEESAEVFLEEYTDEFQENFFNGLQQKGIENYDRAIEYFLICKRLAKNDPTVAHELARVHTMDKQHIPALQYAKESVQLAPGNFWFLNTMIEILEKQSNSFEIVKADIPFKNQRLQENLAEIYLKRKNYTNARQAAQNLEDRSKRKRMQARIEEAELRVKQKSAKKIDPVKENQPRTTEESPMGKVKRKLEQLIVQGDFETLEEQSKEALESFPLQPYFYYANGLAHIEANSLDNAIEVLLSGLEYVFEEGETSKKIYEVLARAYRLKGDETKANEYRSKAKKGL